MMVMVEGCEWLFSFLQPAALQGGKMARERKKKKKKGGSGGVGWVLGGSQVLNSLGKSVGDGVEGRHCPEQQFIVMVMEDACIPGK